MKKLGFLLLFTSLYGSWPMFQHDPKHTGKSNIIGPAQEPNSFLKIELQDPISASPTVGEDTTVYVVTLNGKVAALDFNKGKIKWEREIGKPIKSSPAIKDGKIFFGAQDGYFYALNTSNGDTVWKKEVGVVNSSPSLRGDILYFAAQNSIFAYSVQGVEKWKHTTKSSINSSPAVGDDGWVYFQTYYGDSLGVYGLDASGKRKWFFPTSGGIASPSIGIDGNIYIGDQGGIFYAIDSKRGEVLWQDTLGIITSAPAIGKDGTIYIGSKSTGLFYALNPENGELKGSYSTDNVTASPLIDGTGRVYIGSSNTNFYCLLSDLRYGWQKSLDDRIEVGAAIGPDGTIYVGTRKRTGTVYAFPAKPGIAESSFKQPPTLSLLPNPFKEFTVINFQLPGETVTSLKVYDATGRVVKNFAKVQSRELKVYRIVWNGRDTEGNKIPSGVYFICFRTDRSIYIKRVVLIR